MFEGFIKDELEKAVVGVAGWTGLKHKLYEKIDGLLVQVENLSQDQIRAFATSQRAKLAEDFGEPSPVELQNAPPMKNKKGFADVGIILILGFTAVWIWRCATYKNRITCKQYQEILDKKEHPKGIDLEDHFDHSHRIK